MQQKDEFLSVRGTLDRLNAHDKVVSREKLYREIKGGGIPYHRIGRKIFLRWEEVLSALRCK